MASTYSTNLAIELPGLGEQGGGVWGTTTNRNLGTLIEQAISGYVTQPITDGADTVITIPNGATGVARNMYIECTGTLTANRNLVVPANKKLYYIYNNTVGGFTVTVKVSGQTGIGVPATKKTVLVCNGTDIISAQNYANSISAGSIDGTPIGATTPSTGAFTTVSASTSVTTAALTATGTVSGAGITSLFASPPPIGGTIPAASTFTGVAVTGVTIPNNGMYLRAANNLTFSSAGVQAGYFDATQNLILAHPLAVLQGGTGATTNAGTAYALKANNCSDMTAATVRTNIGLTTMDPGPAPANSTLVQRTSSGYIYGVYFNQSSLNEAVTIGSTGAVAVVNSSADGFIRKISMANFRTQFDSGQFSAAASGWQAFPSGIVLNWGVTGSIGAGGSTSPAFANPYSSACYSVVITAASTGGAAQSMSYVSSKGIGSFTMVNAASVAASYYWMAIGS